MHLALAVFLPSLRKENCRPNSTQALKLHFLGVPWWKYLDIICISSNSLYMYIQNYLIVGLYLFIYLLAIALVHM